MLQYPVFAAKNLTKAANMATKKKSAPPKKEEEKKFIDCTPPGQKKLLNMGMPSSYDPKYVQSAWYSWWEKRQFFHASTEKILEHRKAKKPLKQFTMVIPPPNITGALHVGHALMLSIQDTIVRWKRMNGYECCWLPGQDHAGISTQTVIENMLWKESKQTRLDIGRPEFTKRAWEWKQKFGDTINQQFKRIGISVDWKRFTFTLDELRSKAVQEAFIEMFNRGIIYRSSRLVNWSSALRTALSDLEVEEIEVEKPKYLKVPGHKKEQYLFGQFTNFYYEVEGMPEGEENRLQIATTRLETMLGDTAIAVHPQDERYKNFVGKFARHPFHKTRKIPIITDEILVKMDKGTGVVKVTPAHDPHDFECGQRHKLPQINLFNQNGTINQNGGPYQGLPRFDAREQIFKDLESLGLIKGKSANPMRLRICGKSKDIIEPLIKPQWYVDCKQLASRSIKAVKDGQLKIIPQGYDKVWFKWLENIREWCISRQLWWGHRIPAYLVSIKGINQDPDQNKTENWVVAKNKEQAIEKAMAKWKVTDESLISLKQDQDVLDTWYSSGLFPFSSFGWPDLNSKDLEAFFPGDLLETGDDILFFWVARMVMMSLFYLDKLPFHTVYLHPMVRDNEGKKMSKTRGNVVDPLEVIEGCSLDILLQKLFKSNLPQKEIKRAQKVKEKEFPDGIQQCGTDALRFGLLAYIIQGKSINLDVKRVVGYRHFCNKLWNMSKFFMINILGNEKQGDFKPIPFLDLPKLKLSLIDRWILHRLYCLAQISNKSLENYNFGECAQALYDYFLKEICDIYLEALKPVLSSQDKEGIFAAQQTLFWAIEKGLILLHPLMPFITQELYQRLPHDQKFKSQSICIAQYPQIEDMKCCQGSVAADNVKLINDFAEEARSTISQLNLTGNVKASAFILLNNQEDSEMMSKEKVLLATLGRLKDVTVIKSESEKPEGCILRVVRKQNHLFILVKGLIDIVGEVQRLGKKLVQNENWIVNQKKKMNIPNYEQKVPEKVRLENDQKLKLLEEEREKLIQSLDELNKI